MLTLSERLPVPSPTSEQLVLPFELRSRSRFRAVLDSGEAVGVNVNRGQILRGGDRLRSSCGRVVEIVAAAESVSTVRAENPRLLLRAAYHLGNRHIALQIGPGWLRYSHDHVLDEMVRGLGLEVVAEQAAFEPEGGAYHAESAREHSNPPGREPHDHPHLRHDEHT